MLPPIEKFKIIEDFSYATPINMLPPIKKQKKNRQKNEEPSYAIHHRKIPKWSIFLARAKSKIWNFVLFSVLIEKS